MHTNNDRKINASSFGRTTKVDKYISVLLASFNRKNETLVCLKYLYQSVLPEGFQLEVTLLDDGSTDGTSEAVRRHFPEVSLIVSNGNLFWNGGMRVAWNGAKCKRDYDYFLLLNDDTNLFGNSMNILLQTEKQLRREFGKTGIIVGSICDPVDRRVTYGGLERAINYLGIKFTLLEPRGIPKSCDTFNGNCVLISKEIADQVGVLCSRFSHSLGDYDYGLRAREFGFKCYIAPEYVGTCKKNALHNTWLDGNISFKERKKLKNGPKGLPQEEWIYFVRRHAGIIWILAWAQSNMRLYLPNLWRILRCLRGRDS